MQPSLLLTILTLSTSICAFPKAETDQAIIDNEFYYLSSAIRDTLVANEIIGDVLDEFEPSYYLDVRYLKYHETVLLGNDIPVKAVKKRPIFNIHSITTTSNVANNTTFTLILTDPDATSRDDPKKSEMCHWILTNQTIPSPDFSSEKAGELEKYYAPSPPPKTGPHRYVFVLLEGDASKIKPPKERPHWGYGKVRHGVRDWAEENHLTVVGANFFFAQNKKQ